VEKENYCVRGKTNTTARPRLSAFDHNVPLHCRNCLVVAGDAAYNDVHLFLVESNAQIRLEWISGSTQSRRSNHAQ
jgi:hypothetical protein